jgi:hypothetical protein
MQCPRCKTHDVYRSQSASETILSFMMMSVRCHRCCYLFSVPRWKHVPDKPPAALKTQDQPTIVRNRAA